MVVTVVIVPLWRRWSSCPEVQPPACNWRRLAGWTLQCLTPPFNYLHLWVKQPLRNGLINLLIARGTQCNYIREFSSPSAPSINLERAASPSDSLVYPSLKCKTQIQARSAQGKASGSWLGRRAGRGPFLGQLLSGSVAAAIPYATPAL